MQRKIAIVTLVVCAVMAAPSGLASWNAYGSHEPDSTWDNSDFMQQNPPAPGEKKLYFNAFATVISVANPNVGTAQTKVRSDGAEYWMAMLGKWTDCNGDGYVGLAESAMEEYPSQLLTLPTVVSQCADGTAHNRDGWVSELLWIGPNQGGNQTENNTRIIYDDIATVWGDRGVPVPLVPDQVDGSGGACPIEPVPRGTMQSTGGLLNFAECNTGFLGAGYYNCAILGCELTVRRGTSQEQTVTVPGADPDDNLGLALADDENWNEAGHPLNVGTFGPESSEGSMATVYDCSQPTYAESTLKPLADPTVAPLGRQVDAMWQTVAGTDNDEIPNQLVGEVEYDFGPRPVAPTANPAGTLAGTNNETQEELLGDCDTSNDAGSDTYVLEGDNEPAAVQYKKEADFAFEFRNMKREGSGPSRVLPGTPDNFGVGRVPLGLISLESPYTDGSPTQGVLWDSFYVTLQGTSLVRADISGEVPDVKPQNATFYTFYAKVGQASLAAGSAPSATVGTYGNLFCPSFGRDAGVHHGWDCNPEKWYTNAVDGSAQTLTFNHARPGDTYQFRDTDCFDGSVLGLPVGTSPQRLGDLTCDSAPQAPNPN